MRFLEQVTGGDRELMAFLQRAVGYSLTGSTQEQVLFYLFGLGRNGKTVFMETVLSLLAGYARRIPSESLMVRQHGGGIPNDMAMLSSARVACASETAEGAQLDEARIKEITGGDTIAARFLHKEFFEFKPQFKLWIVGNHRPIIKGGDLGIWRRILLVPFTITIPESEVDPALPAKLRSELPGILVWAVRGCLDWQRNGLGVPRAVVAATQDYHRESDLLGQYIAEKCRHVAGAETSTTDLYQAYRFWAEQSGLKPIAKISFGRKMSERSYPMRQSNGRTLVGGIVLNL
jgi:putative DNA primase/helicase